MPEFKFGIVSQGETPGLKIEGPDENQIWPMDVVLNLLFGEYEVAELNVIRGLYTKEDIVIEGGAGIGITTVALAKMAKKVYAFEPLEDVLRYAIANLALNELDNVELMPAALALATGVVQFYRRNYFAMSSAYPDSGDFGSQTKQIGQLEVPCVDIQQLILDTGANGLHMDIEGMEYELISEMDLSKINKISWEAHPGHIGIRKSLAIEKILVQDGFVHALLAGNDHYPTQSYCIAYVRPEVAESIRR